MFTTKTTWRINDKRKNIDYNYQYVEKINFKSILEAKKLASWQLYCENKTWKCRLFQTGNKCQAIIKEAKTNFTTCKILF